MDQRRNLKGELENKITIHHHLHEVTKEEAQGKSTDLKFHIRNEEKSKLRDQRMYLNRLQSN